ncbi:hypothetical protein M0802_003443 [Mischocyttarus mexicanus]|nr:hypothetical protein M0802_003443 [Mischocyttarus mexicanus]
MKQKYQGLRRYFLYNSPAVGKTPFLGRTYGKQHKAHSPYSNISERVGQRDGFQARALCYDLLFIQTTFSNIQEQENADEKNHPALG